MGRRALLFLGGLLACGGPREGNDADSFVTVGATDPAGGSSTSEGAADASTAMTSAAMTTGDETGIKFDLGLPDGGGPVVDQCKVADDMSGVGPCRQQAPPDSFEPDVQWTFLGPAPYDASIATPLVANLTDDNGDGEIDLCDIPDVVVVAGPASGDTSASRLYVLDGATGIPHFYADELVQFAATPALGDIDGDGLPEIVAVGPGGDDRLRAFEHDGTLKWTSSHVWSAAQSSAIALGDIDADGDVEIIAGTNVYDHLGNHLWTAPNDHIYSAMALADIDDDGQLELLTGRAAYNADGSQLWENPMLAAAGGWQHPQVADFEGDGTPEIIVAADAGIALLRNDGTAVYVGRRPGPDTYDWSRPLNVHDLDGDGLPEFGSSAPSQYGVFEADAMTPVWVSPIADPSGQAGGTAFDFLGAGIAQTVYADEYNLYVFDEVGVQLLSTPRISGTVLEYPVVADIDNDGSAEILVVSNNLFGGNLEFTIAAIRDVKDRWIQARRIWNQHTYHVTNVREDGTIPQHEPKHWTLLNTFRTQAQIEGGGVCNPAG